MVAKSGSRRVQPSEDAPNGTLKPPLKWAGGKRWLVPTLRPLWEPHSHRRLVEPFCGGLAIGLSLAPARALINDINPHAINFYRHLQKGFRVPAAIEMLNDRTTFYEHRERLNALIMEEKAESAEAAALFYYLNRTGYNGLCRFNGKGLFNVPFGRYRSIAYRTDFTEYKRALKPWTFTTKDFQDVRLRKSDFVYVDPPYDVPFTKYSKDGFSWDDQVRLAEWLDKFRGPVVASNQATPRIVALYESKGFRLTFLQGPRRISCSGDRTPAAEILATRGL